MSPSFRRRLLQLHLFAGLGAGAVLTIMAVTGAMMIFRPQLDPVVNPELFAVQPGAARAPLDALTGAALAAYPGRTLNFIRFWAEPRSAMIRCTNSDQIYLDPWTGRVLGLQNRYHGLFGGAENLHRFLGLGTTVGKQIVGAAALVFVFIIVSGFVLWAPPAWRLVKSALTFRRALRGRARLLDWHKTLGAWAGLIVLVSALTGLPHVYEWYGHGLYRLTGSPVPEPPASAPVPANVSRLPAEELWRRAQQLMPQYRSAQIYLPQGANRVAEIWVVEADAPHVHARSYLHLDAVTGAVLRFSPYARSSVGHRLYYWMLSFHLAQLGGVAGQAIMLLGVLSVPALVVTGTWAYFRRRRNARPVPAGEAAPASVSTAP